ncbi:hypothetical protein ACO0RG_003293 [Hanseniaspora osmophila]
MVTNSIIYKSKAVENGISIAGTFNTWKPEPMLYNSSKKYYEYVLKKEELVGVVKVFFKFINNQTGDWFTDDNFSITQDEHGNNNNVMLITPEKKSNETRDKKMTLSNGLSPPAKSMTPGLEIHNSPAPTPKLNPSFDTPKDNNTNEVSNTKVDDKSALEIGVSDKNNSTIEIEVPGADLNKNTEITKKNDQDIDYKNALQKLVLFIKNIFMSWVNWFKH